ncbi:hypothetical protein ACS0TY_025539 [Phlomoides rotata]
MDKNFFCKSSLPMLSVRIKGALCFFHGYGDTCTFFFEGDPSKVGHLKELRKGCNCMKLTYSRKDLSTQ